MAGAGGGGSGRKRPRAQGAPSTTTSRDASACAAEKATTAACMGPPGVIPASGQASAALTAAGGAGGGAGTLPRPLSTRLPDPPLAAPALQAQAHNSMAQLAAAMYGHLGAAGSLGAQLPLALPFFPGAIGGGVTPESGGLNDTNDKAGGAKAPLPHYPSGPDLLAAQITHMAQLAQLHQLQQAQQHRQQLRAAEDQIRNSITLPRPRVDAGDEDGAPVSRGLDPNAGWAGLFPGSALMATNPAWGAALRSGTGPEEQQPLVAPEQLPIATMEDATGEGPTPAQTHAFSAVPPFRIPSNAADKSSGQPPDPSGGDAAGQKLAALRGGLQEMRRSGSAFLSSMGTLPHGGGGTHAE